ncbi:MAG: DUF11 domain-containing protein [Planctomycetaceae bacterium]|jgi:uncharacterized repeat protein (TIGR01451 family)|nr:DUF11 domain-containing protein [Planctomycetaceae bacterium]
MSKKTLYILLTALAVLLFSSVSGTSVYSQDAKKEPTLGQRFKSAFRNIFSDDEEHNHNNTDIKISSVTLSATPMKPPKPVTAAEIKQAQTATANSANNELKTASTQRVGLVRTNRTSDIPAKLTERTAQSEAADAENDENVFKRLQMLRHRVFSAESIDIHSEPTVKQTDAVQDRLSRGVSHVPASNTDDPFLTASRNLTGRVPELRDTEETTKPEPVLQVVPQKIPQQTAPQQKAQPQNTQQQKVPQRINRTDLPAETNAPRDGRLVTAESRQEALSVSIDADSAADKDTERTETRLTVSPRLELTTEVPPKTIVGQEAAYKIRIANTGNAPAEQVSLSAEVPNWIEIRQIEVTGGKALTVPREENPQIADLTWKVSRIEAGKSELLVLRLVPQQRKSVELRIKHDFYRPAAVAKIEVEEPVISMELQGPDEVLWGSEVLYTLIVRNTGNGNAEDLHLELLQTGSDMKECVLPVLRAGEEQPIDIRVWTGKQEHIDINVQANGRYNLKANVTRRIDVRRPSLELLVDAPSILFLGNTAEFGINIRNNGNAAAKDFEVKSLLPLGTQFVSCSNGGDYDGQKNQVLWKVQSLSVGETFTAKIVCKPKTEGECKMDTVVSDQGGVLAEGSGEFTAEAVVELKLNVDNPQRPVEVGKEALYTIYIKNEGTKAAENVEISMAFDRGLEPTDVEGGDAFFNDGQVLFDKKPSIPAGQELVLKVKARADRAANIRVRTDIVCKASNVHLVNEHATYFYEKKK